MPEVLRAWRFRLEPDEAQARLFARTAGACRWVYNRCLSWHLGVLQKNRGKPKEEREPLPRYKAFCAHITLWKKEPALSWLCEVPVDCLQQSARNLDTALSRWYAKTSARPRFKKKGKSRDSFRCPDKRVLSLKPHANPDYARLKLPKAGWTKLRLSQPVQGQLRQATLSREGEHWFVSILTAFEEPVPVHPNPGTVTALDRGVVNTVTDDRGNRHSIRVPTKKKESSLAQLQRKLARQKKGSQNRKKTQHRIQRWHRTYKNRRQDDLHKLTSRLARENQAIVLEALKVTKMTKRAKGTGRKAKAGLNQVILRQGWYELERQLDYKARRMGGEVLFVPAPYTSQRCSRCGHTEKGNRIRQAEFRCLSCGYEENADVNAAKNMLAAAGRAGVACGGSVRPGGWQASADVLPAVSSKQEPVGCQLSLFPTGNQQDGRPRIPRL